MSREIFEKNVAAMEKWYPAFADMIRNEEYTKDDLTIDTEQSWDEELIFKVNKENRTLYLNGKRNAREPIQMWSERIGEIHKYAPFFLIGLGSGKYLKWLLRNSDKTVTVIAYEPSVMIFLRMLEEVDIAEEIKERPIAFVVEGLNGTELEPVVGKLVSLETVEFLKHEIHPNYQELFPEEILKATKMIKDRVRFIFSNKRTEVKFSTHTVKNQILNMKYFCDGYNTLQLSKVIPHDEPAILVSAGPSLDKNIQELKKAKNKAFILAVDTAVKPLIKAGIVPDAFITIDVKKDADLVDIDVIRDVPVIAPVVANYDILKKQRGKKIFYSNGAALPVKAYMKVHKPFRGVSTGGSVACSGFSLLYKMGFRTIILVGQDLAYTGNKSHADGTFQTVMPQEDTSSMIRVKGNYEETLPTRYDFKIYLDWFNTYIEGAKKYRDIRVINATAGGAYINNTELMTLEEAIAETCTKETDYESCIANMSSEFTEEERKKVVEYIHTIPRDLAEIRRDAKDLQRAYRKILKICSSGNMDKNNYLKLLKRVKKVTKKCESKVSYQMVSDTMAMADLIIRSESLYEMDNMKEGGKAIARQGLKFSEMLEECAGLLAEFAEEHLLAIE